jgi:hypothetical protein
VFLATLVWLGFDFVDRFRSFAMVSESLLDNCFSLRLASTTAELARSLAPIEALAERAATMALGTRSGVMTAAAIVPQRTHDKQTKFSALLQKGSGIRHWFDCLRNENVKPLRLTATRRVHYG